VDGVDISPDMLALAEAAAAGKGLRTRLTAQATHELELARSYRTIFMCGVFGIGGRRDHDRETLRRVFRHLEPGGTLLIDHELPYQGQTERSWSIWLAGHRNELPSPWPDTGDRRRVTDGDELELLARQTEFDPLAQTLAYEMRARRWRDGIIVGEEAYGLRENLYFAQEVLLLLEEAGFNPVSVEAGMTDLSSGAAPIQDQAGGRSRRRPATADDGKVLFVAQRPKA
jgi:ubiquinone/menaquinone biosynthesis C-methylase UbiE